MAVGGFTGSNAEADVDYVNASVDVFLDYDSKNREFYFSVPLADSHEFAIVKPAISDIFALLDVAAVHPLKSPLDSVTVSDTAYRVLTKAIADGVALDDSALIDKDYIGTKGNVATMSDILGLLYEHPVADSYSISDVVAQAWDYVRNFNDSILLGDVEFNPLGTHELNSRTLNTANSQFELLKGNDQVDVFGPLSDIIALTPGKNVTDAFTFSDTDDYSIGKGISDTIGLTDYLYIDFKTLTDSLSLADTLVYHYYDDIGIVDNAATVSDSINVSHNSGGLLGAPGIPLNSVLLNVPVQTMNSLVASDEFQILNDGLAITLNSDPHANVVNNVATTSDLMSLTKISGGVLNGGGIPLNNVTLN